MNREHFVESNFRGIENVSEAPEEPGIYVWYSRLKLGRADWDNTNPATRGDGKRLFLKAIKGHIEKHHVLPLSLEARTIFSMTWTGELNPIEPRWLSALATENSEEVVDEASNENENRGILCELLGTASPLFTPPLYIGIAVDQTLRSRLSNHYALYVNEWKRFQGDSSYPDRIATPTNFAERAIKCRFTPDDLHFKTITFSKKTKDKLTLDRRILILRAAEHILNRTSKPVLGRR